MGAYTYLLVQALRDAGPKTTYRDLMDRIGAQIVTRVGNQNPQIEGDADKRLFSGEWAAAGKYFRVRAPQGGEVVVEAGSLHGLAVGSELAVSAPGQEGAGAVRMKVVKLELGLAWLAPVDAKADVSALAKGGQAVEVLSQVEDRGLKIAVAAHGEVVQPVLQGLGFVTVVTGRALSAALPTWDLRILDDGGQVRIERKDGSVLPIPMGKNLPMAAAVPLDDQLAGRVKQAVEGHYRRSRLLALQNTDAASRLDVELQVSHVDAVLEVGPDGKKRPKITKTHKTSDQRRQRWRPSWPDCSVACAEQERQALFLYGAGDQQRWLDWGVVSLQGHERRQQAGSRSKTRHSHAVSPDAAGRQPGIQGHCY
jgi:hypothetical protein